MASEALAVRLMRPGQLSLKAFRSIFMSALSHESGVFTTSCGIRSCRESMLIRPLRSASSSPFFSLNEQCRMTSDTFGASYISESMPRLTPVSLIWLGSMIPFPRVLKI